MSTTERERERVRETNHPSMGIGLEINNIYLGNHYAYEVYASPSGEWATPRSRNHSASRHRDIQRLRDVEPGCIVLYLELHGRAIALAGVEPSEILHTPNNDWHYFPYSIPEMPSAWQGSSMYHL